MATHTFAPGVDIGGGRTIGAASSSSYTGTGVAMIDGETVATAQTDTLINIAIDVSAVKSFVFVSSAAITLETNATDHTGGNIIAIKANVPYIWNTDSYDAFLLTLDVTKFYITNASGATATIYCHCVQDATP